MKPIWGVIFVLSLVTIVTNSCQPTNMNEIPEGIFGKWVTTNPYYKDRYFILSEERVVFGTGNGQYSDFKVAKILPEIKPPKSLYTVVFVDDDGNTYKRAFYYHRFDNGEFLMFKNQENIPWQKTS